jgi:hypothetical protein
MSPIMTSKSLFVRSKMKGKYIMIKIDDYSCIELSDIFVLSADLITPTISLHL